MHGLVAQVALAGVLVDGDGGQARRQRQHAGVRVTRMTGNGPEHVDGAQAGAVRERPDRHGPTRPDPVGQQRRCQSRVGRIGGDIGAVLAHVGVEGPSAGGPAGHRPQPDERTDDRHRKVRRDQRVERLVERVVLHDAGEGGGVPVLQQVGDAVEHLAERLARAEAVEHEHLVAQQRQFALGFGKPHHERPGLHVGVAEAVVAPHVEGGAGVRRHPEGDGHGGAAPRSVVAALQQPGRGVDLVRADQVEDRGAHQVGAAADAQLDQLGARPDRAQVVVHHQHAHRVAVAVPPGGIEAAVEQRLHLGRHVADRGARHVVAAYLTDVDPMNGERGAFVGFGVFGPGWSRDRPELGGHRLTGGQGRHRAAQPHVDRSPTHASGQTGEGGEDRVVVGIEHAERVEGGEGRPPLDVCIGSRRLHAGPFTPGGCLPVGGALGILTVVPVCGARHAGWRGWSAGPGVQPSIRLRPGL